VRDADDGREGSSNVGVFGRIEARLDRIEDKLDIRMTTLDRKMDGISARQDRLEGQVQGIVAIVKWLGPAGIVALLFGLLMLYGFLPSGTL
jgi:hypothetical protein